MGRGVAQFAVVAEHIQGAGAHLASAGGVVVLKHLAERLPQLLQVGFVKAGLPGKVGGDKTVGAIQAIGHGVFAAHGAVVALLFFGFGFGSDCHTGDAVFLRHNRVD